MPRPWPIRYGKAVKSRREPRWAGHVQASTAELANGQKHTASKGKKHIQKSVRLLCFANEKEEIKKRGTRAGKGIQLSFRFCPEKQAGILVGGLLPAMAGEKTGFGDDFQLVAVGNSFLRFGGGRIFIIVD